MNIGRFFDRVQLNLHLLGFHRLAFFFGRWGSRALPSDAGVFDRLTIRSPVFTVPDETITAGPGWSLHEVETDGPLKAIDFDPTFAKNNGIDVSTDVAFPSSDKDIN